LESNHGSSSSQSYFRYSESRRRAGLPRHFKISITAKNFPPRNELLREFYKLPLEFEPGETWSYDNTGYYLLGIIVEKASGKDFWQFLDEKIFKPLG
jgi:CubicO group peptidase (beta-lactamase class C family)